MPPPALHKLATNIANIEYTRSRIEKLHTQNRVVKRDVESMYEALYLRAVTGFEVFLEELFIAILKEKIIYKRGRAVVRMKAASDKALIEILLQGREYLNWLPFTYTEERAKIYLRDGKPFTEFSNGDKSMIKTIIIVRNAIAHKSPNAMKEFRDKVIGSRLLLPREKTPAGFLRSVARRSPDQRQFEIYVSELSRLASKLC